MVYNVYEISKMLNVSEETVRRWIRNGKLKSECKSKKQGNVIKRNDLEDFLNNNPKYKFAFKLLDGPLNKTEIAIFELKQLREYIDKTIDKLTDLLEEES